VANLGQGAAESLFFLGFLLFLGDAAGSAGLGVALMFTFSHEIFDLLKVQNRLGTIFPTQQSAFVKFVIVKF
jgi:hypothetical protein